VSIVLIGINYRTAPVELREVLALQGCALRMALQELSQLALAPGEQAVSEAAILSTCNRLEIYVSARHPGETPGAIVRFLAHLQNVPLGELEPHVYQRSGEEAARHLMRVACGLDSMVLGETQVLGQVTQAFEEARAAGTNGPILSHLFTQAIHTGKRARSETAISQHTTSVAHAGVHLVMEQLRGRESRRVLIVGAGEMAVMAAEALRRYAGVEVAFINRTYGRAEALAVELGGQALPWHELELGLVWADAVMCATGAPHTVIYTRDVAAILPRRAGRPLAVVDIAVPRDVEETLGTLEGIAYYDIDDLQLVVDSNLELRKAAVPAVKRIVQEELETFTAWFHSRQVAPVIRDLRARAQELAADELAQALNRLPAADERTQQVLGRLAHRLVNRLLHEPTVRLRAHAADGNGHGYAHALRDLFALDLAESGSACACGEAANEQENGAASAAVAPCDLHCILQP
jgi:glutamyl-tRNA reductase